MEDICRNEGHPTEAYEILLVDDGSSDNSWNMIKDLHKKDARVKGVSFSRNFGHHIAITAGLDYAKGNAVVLMDGDLQDPPEEIPKLYEKFKEGFDIVYGIRQQRHDTFFKKISSVLFWRILRRFSGVDMPKGQTMLRVVSKRVVGVLREMREHARFIHGMMAWTGFNVFSIEIQHGPRLKGRSKYNMPKMFRLAFHAVTSFSTVPLKFASYMGFVSSFFSLIIGLFFLYRKIFYNIPVVGYASTIVSIFFIGGIQLLVLGILGEYLGRTYQELQKRPLYITKDSLF
jgi:polyisoprenyl-phosphate glycosyltransferase